MTKQSADKRHISTVIAAKHSIWFRGWQAILSGMGRIAIVDYVDDIAILVSHITESCPDLLLLDSSLVDENVISVLSEIQTLCPQIVSIVVADYRSLQQAATAAGADAVLLRGFQIEELYATIVGFFPEPNTPEGYSDNPDRRARA